MTSIYERALGRDFHNLHPKMQERFGFSSADGKACIGRGVMDRLWHGPGYTLPFLYLGSWRRIMFPEQGRHVPFTVQNYAYQDALGRETVTWIRTFETRKRRRFDAYMIFSEQRGRIVDYLGTHQHLAVDIELAPSDCGGLRLRSGEQRFYERAIGFKFPLICSGVANVHEWFDEKVERYRIEVEVRNRAWGKLFGYEGWFAAEWKSVEPDKIPPDIFPRRTERRE